MINRGESHHVWSRLVPCGSDFCYHDGECISDAKTGEKHCSCVGNYTLADCSAEKCSKNGPLCYNDASCERDEDGTLICQCIGQWGGADCSASTPSLTISAVADGFVCAQHRAIMSPATTVDIVMIRPRARMCARA